MFRATRKFIAVILAIWLPLFSGNALAVSAAMQAMRGDCHSAAAQQGESHCAPAVQQHAHHDAADQSHQDQQNTAGDDCGSCHLACCGYLAVATLEVAGVTPAARLFASAATQFRSITSAPLDPPPLARA